MGVQRDHLQCENAFVTILLQMHFGIERIYSVLIMRSATLRELWARGVTWRAALHVR